MEFNFQERPSDAPFVERVWQTESLDPGSFISLAASQWEMVVTNYAGKTTFAIRGPATRASHVDFPADAQYFGIVFKLGTFMPKLPTVDRLNGNNVDLPETAFGSVWLNSSTWQVPTFENADTFAGRLVREGLLAYDPLIDTALHQHQQLDLSPRSLQYHFLVATGLPHKVIQQIERAGRARTLLLQGNPILDTVFEAGYFDQAHLTNSLKRYVGQTPAQILRKSA